MSKIFLQGDFTVFAYIIYFFKSIKNQQTFLEMFVFTFRRSEKQYIVHMKKLLLFSFILEWLERSMANWGKGLKDPFLEGKKERWKNLCA